jgi:aminoglycoside/choline kinase family phosphotransferase
MVEVIEPIEACSRFFGVEKVEIKPLTPDASTRRYFRASVSDESVIVCMYGESFLTAGKAFVDTYELLSLEEVAVPKVLAVYEDLQVIVQEDLTDESLYSYLEKSLDSVERLRNFEEAIRQMVLIQKAGFSENSKGRLCTSLAFDEEKLGFEMSFFMKHYFESYLCLAEVPKGVFEELQKLCKLLSERRRVLVHRDYHSGNLMLDKFGKLRVIDFQDARMGPETYDLVPLLVERRSSVASEDLIRWGISKYLQFCEELNFAPPYLEKSEVRNEFGLMAIQRELKAIGSFSWLSAVCARREQYEKFIPIATQTVVKELEFRRDEFPVLLNVLQNSD